jgi:AraC-like DNA-binding protein
VKSGLARVAQCGREALIKAGDCFLFYSGEPGSYQLTSCEVASFFLPRDFILRWIPFPFDATSVSLSKLSPWGNALSATFEALKPQILESLAVPPDVLMEQVCCLLSLTLGPPRAMLRSYRLASYQRFRQTMLVNFCEPDFDLSALAREHCVSTRTIQFAFASARTNFERELLTMRMEKARGILDDSRHDKKSIGEIGALVGYRYTSHFVAHFHATYGLPPEKYRKMRRS